MFDATAIKELSRAQAIEAANREVSDDTAALPNDFQIHDLEKFGATRRRARGTMTTNNLASFTAYVTQHAESGAAVFVDQAGMKAVAVLNLGNPEAPGHADNTAVLQAKKTAPYTALCNIAGKPITQQAAAEFMEDWAAHIACGTPGVADDPTMVIPIKHAIAAVRAITIDAARKTETKVQSLSEERSDFERVQASSGAAPIPTEVLFRCEPYHGLAERTFAMRLGIVTTDKPSIVLRVIAQEKHDEEMAEEMAKSVGESFGSDGPQVILGAYSARQ